MAASDHINRIQVFHAEPMSSRGEFLRAQRSHVGTERAALARVHPDHWEPDESFPPSVEYAEGRTRLWVGELRPDAKMGPMITDTQANKVAEGRDTSFGSSLSQHDVLPYTNEYEDPGSTSFVVRPRATMRWRPVASGPDKIARRIENA